MIWMKYLHVPSEADFCHGAYATRAQTAVYSIADLIGARATFEQHCGTQCCLVGHVAVAFREPSFSDIKSRDGKSFLRKFCELAGQPVPRGDDPAGHASRVFEGCADHRKRALTPKRARRLWIKTGEHFGFTVDAPGHGLCEGSEP